VPREASIQKGTQKWDIIRIPSDHFGIIRLRQGSEDVPVIINALSQIIRTPVQATQTVHDRVSEPWAFKAPNIMVRTWQNFLKLTTIGSSTTRKWEIIEKKLGLTL
jgi:hypothetical protein